MQKFRNPLFTLLLFLIFIPYVYSENSDTLSRNSQKQETGPVSGKTRSTGSVKFRQSAGTKNAGQTDRTSPIQKPSADPVTTDAVPGKNKDKTNENADKGNEAVTDAETTGETVLNPEAAADPNRETTALSPSTSVTKPNSNSSSRNLYSGKPKWTDEEWDKRFPVVPEAKQMVLEVLVPTRQLFNKQVLKAMMRTARAEFVAKEYRMYAYEDLALAIGESQTISPPFIVAYMTEQIDPQPTDRVLEIGTGSGYQAAVLSGLVDEVYTIEIVKPLGKKAASLLKKLGYDNVHVRIGDGYQGWPEYAPFDKIIVTCSPEEIPQPLIDQLKDGGQILIPIGERYQQYFYQCTKHGNTLDKQTLIPAYFVPMTGEAEEKRIVQPDPKNPTLVGGGFEETNPPLPNAEPNAPLTPKGWYYTRNVTVKNDAMAPEGHHILVFDNLSISTQHQKKDRISQKQLEATLPENRDTSDNGSEKEELLWRQRNTELQTHALQGFPVDGQSVKKLDFSCWIRAVDITPLNGRRTIPVVSINFFDKNRKIVGEHTIVIALSEGSFDWKQFERQDIAVPRKATEATLQIGIPEGVGYLEMDDIVLTKSDKHSVKESKNSR